MKRHSQQGVALIITLILLAVVTVMAVAFLASSRRERGAVTTTTDTASARLATDAALAQAEAQIMANVLATTNPYNFGLLVSTNYINSFGFDPAAQPNPTNVNYDYLSVAGTYTPNDQEQNIANLLYSPRAPVFIQTNTDTTKPLDFRFYLDLNRNGIFDTNGIVTNVNNGVANGTISEVGDPEWIGVLDHPDQPHGPNNRFIARYAFVAVPIGNALDLNAIHNQVLNNNSPLTANDGFFRNEGVGSWEINLAAFLADLNTNEWGQNIGNATWYQYNEANASPFANSGDAFDDARALLAYRYNDNYNSLYSLQTLYGVNGYSAYANGVVDTYTLGKLMTNTYLPLLNAPATSPSWAGADNTNHFFDMQELFNPNESSQAFTNRLLAAGNVTPAHQSTYDRYTFYRLLSQLGTDSAPEQNKMNLNYVNVDANGNVVPGMETNFFQWSALQFFTNAADRMLRAYSQEWLDENPSNYLATYFNTNGMTNIPLISITDIPVYVNGTNVYSPAVNRVLQLAANMYDATTNNTFALGADFPNVFQPVFSVTGGNVYITNFVEVTSTNFLANPLLNLNYGTNVIANLQSNPSDLVFGVPLIIGAKKGFPNFNEFYMENVFQLTRKLQVTRSDTNATVTASPSAFNYYEMFNLSLSNHLGVELWNSYTNTYTRQTDIYVNDYMTTALTNDENLFSYTNNLIASTPITNVAFWPGYNLNFPTNSFLIPLATNFPAVPVGTYRFNGGNPYVDTNLNLSYETNTGFGPYPQPHWGMTMTNNLQVIMVDHNTGRLIDYVQLSGPNTVRDLTAEIQRGYDTVNGGNNTKYNDLWDTILNNGVPIGIANQLQISSGNGTPVWSLALWGAEKTAYDQMNAFRIFTMGPNTFMLTYPGYPGLNSTQIGIAATTNALQAPYTPTATVVQHITWQANDPLVHYIASDLNNPALGNGLNITTNWPANLGLLNPRYMPWGGNPILPIGTDTNAYTLALKDPLVSSSDHWDFPTYKLPTVGWLGRVHRGTPWQTVYLKASNILKTSGINTWINRTGNTNAFDATNTAPVEDRLLFDLFTTAPNDNATRGQLSVNVGATPTGASLAAWSALFSGMVVLTNTAVSPQITGPSNSWMTINPAGVNGTNLAVGQLAVAINTMRANFTNADGLAGTFEHKGDILSTLQLTEQSPFLNWNTSVSLVQQQSGISDEMYEWLPQQAMSLLRVANSPRYVIYCYGQTLKPAQNGIVTGGSLFGICTNYQVVAETATRAVVQFNSTMTHVISTNGVLLSTSMPVINSTNAVIENFNVLPPN